MKRFFMLLAVVMLVTVVAACSSSSKNNDANTPSSGSSSSTETNNNTGANTDTGASSKPQILTVASIASPKSLDYQAISAGEEKAMIRPMYGFLLDYDVDGSLVPSLATSYEVLNDTQIKFVLREDAYFHNGRQFEAKDVKYSFERMIDPETGSPLRSQLSVIESIETPSQFEVILNLEKPSALLIEQLADAAIVAEEDADSLADAPVSIGPFAFSAWNRDQELKLKKFDQYWDDVTLDELNIKIIMEANTARSALLAKDVDGLLKVSPQDVEQLEANQSVVVDSKVMPGGHYLAFNMGQTGPWQDVRVREAIKYAIDRDAILKTVYSGVANEAYSLFPPYDFNYNSDWEYEMDLEKAKQLLAEAGYPDGFDMTLSSTNDATQQKMGLAFQDQFKKIGINLKLDPMETANWLEKVYRNKDFDTTMSAYYGAGSLIAANYDKFKSDVDTNFFNYSDENFDKYIDLALVTYDADERKEYVHEAINIIHDQVAWIITSRTPKLAAVQDYVNGFINLPNRFFNFNQVTIDK